MDRHRATASRRGSKVNRWTHLDSVRLGSDSVGTPLNPPWTLFNSVGLRLDSLRTLLDVFGFQRWTPFGAPFASLFIFSGFFNHGWIPALNAKIAKVRERNEVLTTDEQGSTRMPMFLARMMHPILNRRKRSSNHDGRESTQISRVPILTADGAD